MKQAGLKTDSGKSAATEGRAGRSYVFGVFRIDAEERLLHGPKGIVRLTPKAFDTLLLLVEQSGHLLSKTELMEKLWPDSFVEENNLVQQIFALRKALGAEDGSRKYIETLPRRGYCFVADVLEGEGETEGKSQTAAGDNVRAGHDERQQAQGRPPLRNVVIIGRAIDFR